MPLGLGIGCSGCISPRACPHRTGSRSRKGESEPTGLIKVDVSALRVCDVEYKVSLINRHHFLKCWQGGRKVQDDLQSEYIENNR